MGGKENKIIFIAGTGRSGTHLIGRTVASHPEVDGRIEVKDTFNLITKIATTQDYTWNILNKLRLRLLSFKLNDVRKKTDKHVLEKSHPSLWIADYILKKPCYRMIGVKRNPYATVNSMLKHKGVLNWYNKLPLNKKNSFLGIDEENASYFYQLSLEEQCTLRWISHNSELDRLKRLYDKQFTIINYDEFVKRPNEELQKIAEFIELKDEFEVEELKHSSLWKWENELTNEQKNIIKNTIAKAQGHE